MKTKILIAKAILVITAATINVADAQDLTLHDRIGIVDAITHVAAGADRHQWERVRSAMTDTVRVDYTSLWGGEPATQTADSLVEQWSKFLPGFEQTHHMVVNHTIVSHVKSQTVVQSDFQATHRIGDEYWQLIGRYEHTLQKVDGTWLISGVVMTRTHEYGDRNLVDKAAGRTQQSE